MAEIGFIDFGDNEKRYLKDRDLACAIGLPAGAGKNLLENTASTQTTQNHTLTVNADKTITVTSTAATAAQVVVYLNQGAYIKGDGNNLVLSGCPSGGSLSTYSMQVHDVTSGAWGDSDIGSGLTFTTVSGHEYEIALIIRSGARVENKTFSPMVRMQGTSPDYVPYSESVMGEIGEMWEANAVTGVHNFLSPNARSITISGLTITAYEDGRVTLDGTYTGDSFYSFMLCSTAKLANIKNVNLKMRLDGQNVPSALQIQSFKTDGTNTRTASSNTDTDILVTQSGIDISNSGMFLIVGAALKNVQIDNLTVYTMIRLASDTDTTYQPYAMTNRELTTFLQTTKGTMTAESPAVLHTANRLYKIGNIVILDLHMTAVDAETNGNTLIATIPSGYRPADTLQFPLYVARVDNQSQRIICNSAGEIKIHYPSTALSNNEVIAVCVWAIE